jgi:hypothetical protein
LWLAKTSSRQNRNHNEFSWGARLSKSTFDVPKSDTEKETWPFQPP